MGFPGQKHYTFITAFFTVVERSPLSRLPPGKEQHRKTGWIYPGFIYVFSPCYAVVYPFCLVSQVLLVNYQCSRPPTHFLRNKNMPITCLMIHVLLIIVADSRDKMDCRINKQLSIIYP
jgi:hypothetical protein